MLPNIDRALDIAPLARRLTLHISRYVLLSGIIFRQSQFPKESLAGSLK
jgi:hypothetical protein